MPGVAVDERRSRILGLAALTLVVVVASSLVGYNNARGDTRLRVVLHTEQIGDGIIAGTSVALDGVTVGSIEQIESASRGTQLITLQLDRAALPGLTDRFGVDYAPSNMFGISEIELERGTGGSPLTDGAVIDLIGEHAGKVADATMGSLMRSLSQTSNDVLTSQFSDVLTKVGSDLVAFTPILEAIVMLSRSIADTQRYPSSFLLEQYASAMTGLVPMASGVIDFVDSINRLEILRTNPQLFDATVQMLVHQLLPAVTGLGSTTQRYFDGYTTMLTPLLNLTAQMVPTPALSGAQIRELLDRVDRSLTDTPDGPMLNVAVTLRGVPGLAVPLLGLAATPNPGGGR